MSRLAFLLAAMLVATTVSAQDTPRAHRRDPQPASRYSLGPDSLKRSDVPQGRLEGPFEFRSKIVENTVRLYWVYVPAQYDPANPANLLVFHDGARAINPNGVLRVQNVLENLTAKNEIPPTIGICITPGQRGDVFPDSIGTGNPDNRDREYDVLDDNFSRMLIEEILPEVAKKYRFSSDPARRAIGGASSGGIAAFTTAWHFPNEFRNVISLIGSFTNIHGGHVYPQLVRDTPKKTIRVFLQDGIHDNRNPNNVERDWYLQNKAMAEAFEAKGYDYAYVLGDGPHADDHGGAILPYMLRWVWRDLPGIETAPADDLVAAAKAIKSVTPDPFPGFDANAQVNPVGAWSWTTRSGGEEVTSTLTITNTNGTLSGTLVSPSGVGPSQPQNHVDLTSIELHGNKLFVDGSPQMVTQGQNTVALTTSYQGIIDGDQIVGWELRDRDGAPRDRRWRATRAR